MADEADKEQEEETFVFNSPGNRGHGKSFQTKEPGMLRGEVLERAQVGDYNMAELAKQRARAQRRK